MDPKDIEEMQASFASIYGRKAEFADRFYVHLFARMPEAEAMFVGDFAKQKEMFAAMLTYCLKGISDHKSLVHAGDALAKTHARFDLGAREAELAIDAMMAAFDDVLGGDLAPTQREVWRLAITRIAGLVLTDTSQEH
ncbi:globin domain-containing protein [Pseudophaeobacter flagellatus]|uniref:globin domain-containing protein n=1 Tax=Pseudophaeobacter flagellatus TaxID=2899119 RepID=UPI001E422E3C|nr:globin domain-containing protein [Pseudophaeobacter flagellatus]MCD9147980.1 globin domain-containing protein [Pseudophaeobacter flagellatus]